MRNRPNGEKITLGERVATAFVSAIAAALTLLGYFVISVAFASKAPSGPPKLLFEVFASKFSIGLIVAASLAGFVLGPFKMADVFAEFWGTAPQTNATGSELMKATLIIIVAVAVITHFTHGS